MFAATSRIAQALTAAALLLVAPAFAPLAAQDTRTVTEPVFPAVCTVLTSQMAIVNGGPASELTPDTTRIQAALTACGSGKAVELSGSGSNFAFLSAPLNIPSGVSLIVDGGVTLFASRNREDYQTATISSSVDECGTQGPNGNGCKNFINFNNGSTNVGSGIYGYGVIDGRGYATTLKAGADTGISWWLNADSIPSGYSQNNPIIMKLSKSTNFTLYKITIRNSPEFHVGWSGTGFTAWGVKIQAPFTAHNTDGIDPQGSNVTITNSSISDGDDNVAVGASSASANITVSNTTTYSGHGISVGSYTQGGLTNMLVTNINMAGTGTDGNATGIRLKSSQDRGGLLQNITYQNMCLKDMRHILQFTPFYNTNSGTLIPQFTNVTLQNLHFLTPSTGASPYIVALQGHDATHLSTITLNNIVFDSLTQANTVSTPPEYESFTLAGNVYPAFLTTLTGTGVSYTGSATSVATGAYDCSASSTFPYEVGELFLSTPSATNLQTGSATNSGGFTLNAMLQPAMATAAYTGTAGTWTGAAAMTKPVNFLEGSTVVGAGVLGANGANSTLATLTLTGVTPGTHTYTAQYPGDSNYGLLNFGSVTVTVTAAALTGTTTTLSVSNNGGATLTYGTALTLTSSVTPTTGTGTPTGSIRFFDGTTVLATVPLTGTTASTSQVLGGGNHALTAAYLGDVSFSTSTSTASSTTIVPAAELIAVTASATTLAYGSTLTLTANVPTVTGASTPTGALTILENTTVVGSANLDANGNYAVTITPTPGTHQYHATYAGDANYAASTGSNNVVITDKASSVSTVKITGSTTYGSISTVIATVAAASTPATTLVPTGDLTFPDTAGYGAGVVPTGALTNGTASTQILYSTGSHTVSVAYTGDNNFNASTSAGSTFVITQATPAVALAIGATSLVTGTGTTLTTTLTGVTGAATPTGSILFYDGTNSIGTCTLLVSGATAKCQSTPTYTTLGSHSITAVYSGDTNYTTLTSAATVITITGVPTFTLSSSASAYTLAPGGSANPVISVTPANGFTATVTLSCTSPVSYITCSVPTSVNVNGTNAATANATITVAATVASQHDAPLEQHPTTWLAALLPLSLAGLLRRRKLLQRALLTLTAFAVLTMSGCGGASTSGSTSPKLPPAGTQQLTVTAVSGSITTTAAISVTITN